MIRQSVPRPRTWAEFESVKYQLVDTHGDPLVSGYCVECGTRHFSVEPHLAEVPCPSCGSTGRRCERPSEHEAGWHTGRRSLLETVMQEREAAGLPVPARWPDERPALFEMEELT